MKNSLYVRDQYIDAPSLTNNVTAVSGNLGILAAAGLLPGVIAPESMSFAYSGLTVTASLPAPVAVLFGTGVIAQAHGTQTNADSQSYAVSFSGVVPGSGSVTAYLLAAYASISGTAFTVIGPPPGHPDYDPTYAPYTAYTYQLDSLSLSASTTAPDNSTTFELGRVTLAAGATGISSLTTAFQNRVSGKNVYGAVPVSGAVSPGVTGMGKMYIFTASGSLTLPLTSGSAGLSCGVLSATSGAVTMAITAPDLFYGYGTTPASGVASIAITQGASLIGEANNAQWNVIGGSLAGIGGGSLITGVTAGTGLTGGGTSGAVTVSISGIGAHSWLANNTAGTVAPSGVTVTQFFDTAIGTTPGTFIQRGVSTWAATPTGVSGQVWTYAGSGAAANWANTQPNVPGTLTVSGSITVTTSQLGYTFFVSATGQGAAVLTWPSAVSAGAGWWAIICSQQADGDWASVTPSAGTLDGVSTRGGGAGTRVKIQSDGTNWNTVEGKWRNRSTFQAISAFHAVTYDHFLGVAPLQISTVGNLKCTSTNAAYSVGDVIPLTSTQPDNANDMCTVCNSINGAVCTNSQLTVSSGLNAARKDTFVNQNLDLTKWLCQICVEA